MPIGDSLTVGLHWDSANDDSYRPYLWRELTSKGYDVDFVGTMQTGDGSYDGDNDGFGGFTMGPDNGFVDANGKLTNNLYAHIAAHIAVPNSKNEKSDADIVTFSDPDVVLLNVGTNDAESDSAKIFERLNGLVALIRLKAPDAIVVVSSVTPSDAAVLELVGPQARRIAEASDGRVLYADIRGRMTAGNTELSAAPFTPEDWQGPTDRHLSATGGPKFAAAWFPTVVQALSMPRCASR